MLWYALALFLRPFIIVKSNRIILWSYNFNKYACNPKAISDYIINNHPGEFEVIWAFNKHINLNNIDKRVKIVKKYSLRYIYALYSSKFIITNARNNKHDSLFLKKWNQKYIMTWHSSIRLKKIERDAEIQLGDYYVKVAKQDSKMCDLMLSNSTYYTKQIPTTFWYYGEILEQCIPRNDIFYNQILIDEYRYNTRKTYNIGDEEIIVLYAPTFRNKIQDLDIYNINWTEITTTINKRFKKGVKVFIKLHPNLINLKNFHTIITSDNVIDVTQAGDITPFLFASDIVITDYTSAMFDCAIINKPCFIYAKDYKDYDRGFYWELKDLPFPIAYSDNELNNNINNFNNETYLKNIRDFKDSFWGLNEDGKACERLYNWIKKNRECSTL